MPKSEKNDEITGVYCCCFKKTLSKDGPYTQITYSHLQETMKVPFTGDVPNNLTIGSAICITGTIKEKCTRFAVDLICKKEPNSDIAFHFNPRLDRHYVVRNAKLDEKWGTEEAASSIKSNLNRTEKFEIIFLIVDGEFLVSINGRHFCSFKFRVQLNLITHIEVLGEVEVFGVDYKKCGIYPEIRSCEKRLIIEVGNEEEQPEELLVIPCTGHLPKGFEVGWQFEVYGRVKLLPHSFYINLQDGSQIWPHPIIPLHLNPRFRCVGGESIIVRNAWLDGRWGPEERSPGFPFSPGAEFCIAIRRGNDRFSVWIDGQLTGEFKFRGGTSSINAVYIQGDIELKKLVIYNKYVELHKPKKEIIKL